MDRKGSTALLNKSRPSTFRVLENGVRVILIPLSLYPTRYEGPFGYSQTEQRKVSSQSSQWVKEEEMEPKGGVLFAI